MKLETTQSVARRTSRNGHIAAVRCGRASSTDSRAEIEKRVYRLALLLTANPTDAEKVSRQALARAWQVLLESGAENASEPLMREVVFGALDALRLRRGDLRGWLEDPLTDMQPLPVSSSAELRRVLNGASEGPRLTRALDELVPLDRIVLLLREVEQLSLDEAARLLRISRHEASLRLNRARVELEQQLARRPSPRTQTFTIYFPGSAMGSSVQNT